MTRPDDDRLLDFLEGRLGEAERNRLLDELDASPELAQALRSAARGLEAMHRFAAEGVETAGRAASHAAASVGTPAAAPAATRGAAPPAATRRISPWWALAAAAAAVSLAVPGTWWLASRPTVPATSGAADAGPLATGVPAATRPTFVLVLHGRWDDLDTADPDERVRRRDEYWGWTSSLARSGLLVAAGDLSWEPGELLAPGGHPVRLGPEEVDRPEYVVGMYALRVGSYEEALALARECPHLRYGGAVSVRRVGAGFVTVPGMSDWAG